MFCFFICFVAVSNVIFASPISQISNDIDIDKEPVSSSQVDLVDMAEGLVPSNNPNIAGCNSEIKTSNSLDENIDSGPNIYLRRDAATCPATGFIAPGEKPPEKGSPTQRQANPLHITRPGDSEISCPKPDRSVLVTCGGRESRLGSIIGAVTNCVLGKSRCHITQVDRTLTQ